MDVKLNKNQALELANLISKFGLEVPVSGMSEAKPQPELTLMNSQEIVDLANEGGAPVLQVDEKVIKMIPQVIEEFKESANWYYNFNKSITSILGKREGGLLLAMIASYSANTKLEPNLALATRSFYAIKRDLADNKNLLIEYIDYMQNMSTADFKKLKFYMADKDAADPTHKFTNLKYHNFIVKHSTLQSHIQITNKITRYYIDQGEKFDNKRLAQMISTAIKSSGDINKKDAITGGYKVLNFALNLLDPDMVVGGDKFAWLPVTIDSWMIYFFYPEVYDMVGKDKSDRKGAVFSKYKHYVYLGKLVQEQAAKYGMKPHQLQAVIWIATIRKRKPNESSKNIHSTLTHMIQSFNKDQNKNNQLIEFTNKLQKVLA